MTDAIVIPAFYVLRDDRKCGKKYYGGRTFDRALEETRSHYDRTVGAQKDVTKLEREGYDCSKVVMVPVFLTPGQPIVPKRRAQKSGYVLEITIAKDPEAKPHYRGHEDQVYYWKGNKKKPMDYYSVDDGVPQTITASVFKTRKEADAKLVEWHKAYKEREVYLIEKEKENHAHWRGYWEARNNGDVYVPNDWHVQEWKRTTCQAIEV